jgi:crotonobetaine/carnitine-CoA ligase
MTSSEPSAAEQLATLAQTCPHAILMTYLDSGECFSNSQVYQSALSWAAALRDLGVGPGDSVSVMMPAQPDTYFAWLGIAWLRALETPINTDHRGSSLAHVLNNSNARVAIVSRPYLDRFFEARDRIQTLRTIIVPDDDSPPQRANFHLVGRAAFFSAIAPLADPTPPGPKDIACVVYTSGTTGASKGVVIPWAEMTTFGPCLGPVTGRDFRLYSAWTLFHIAGKFALTEPIRRGGSLIFRERWRTSEFWNDIRAYRATSTGFLGGVSNFLMSQPETPEDADNSLTDVLMAPVIPQFRDFEKRFGLRIHTGFASSEVRLPLSGAHPLPNHRTCGRLVPGYEIRLSDRAGNEVGPNEIGEAWVRAAEPDWICHGYLNMPDKTAEATADGWFHTGDGLMRDEDGNYYYVDRMKDCIRRRGQNISSFEVENEVNAHPEILESAAFEVKGDDGDGEVMIAVVRHAGSQLSESQLIEFLVPHLPRFMMPRFIEFVDELPKTHTNRTRKIELRERGVTEVTWDRVKAGVTLAR